MAWVFWRAQHRWLHPSRQTCSARRDQRLSPWRVRREQSRGRRIRRLAAAG